MQEHKNTPKQPPYLATTIDALLQDDVKHRHVIFMAEVIDIIKEGDGSRHVTLAFDGKKIVGIMTDKTKIHRGEDNAKIRKGTIVRVFGILTNEKSVNVKILINKNGLNIDLYKKVGILKNQFSSML